MPNDVAQAQGAPLFLIAVGNGIGCAIFAVQVVEPSGRGTVWRGVAQLLIIFDCFRRGAHGRYQRRGAGVQQCLSFICMD